MTQLSVESVRKSLTGVRRAGSGWVAHCPVHDDKQQSLSIGEGQNGRVLLNCHAGCSFDSIVRAMNVSARDLAPTTPLTDAHGAILATYDYVDEHATLLYQVVRKVGKHFAQRRPDGSGGWIWNLQGVRQVPYKLPELIEGISLGRTVFVVEGEKDVESLCALGLTATTNSGGAGKGRDEFAPLFEGANVIILPDNDEPGRKHAASWERSLTGFAASIKTINLPGLPEKGDVSDWLAAGGSVEKLLELIQQPQDSDEGLPLPIRAIDVTPNQQNLRFAFRDFAIASEYGLIIGEDGQYKTTVMIHLAGAFAARAKAFNHFQAEDSGDVLFISGEDSEGVLTNRLRAMCRGHGWNLETVLSRVHILALSGVDITGPAWKAHLLSFVERFNIKLILLDPMRDLMEGDENASKDVKPFNDLARALKKPTNATVFAGHHLGKGEDRSTKDRIRGSTGIRGASRRTIAVSDMAEEKAIRVESVKFSKMPKQLPFMVRRIIESEPENPAVWTLARFEYATAYAVEFDKAESFIRQLLSNGMEMNSSEIRTAAKKKVGGVAINSGIKNLEMRRLISFREGPNNSKLWRWAEPVSDPGQADRPSQMPVGQADRLSDNPESPPLCLSVPYRGTGNGTGLTTADSLEEPEAA